ncbi:MAG: metal ABC transporter substrate-binding protein [Planctomycetota bacterium]
MKRLMLVIMLVMSTIGLEWIEDKELNVCFADASQSLRVLTTTSDLKSITEEIGGKYVQVTSICAGNQDPHFAEAKPSIIVNARKADLLVVIGLELEVGYEPLIIEGARNAKIKPGADGYLDVSDGVLLRELPTGKVDRSMGDVHPFGNPHYWLDPYNARIMSQNISNRLQKIDPTRSADYQANYQAFIKKIDEAMFGAEATAKIGGDKLWEQEISGKLDEFIKGQEVQLGGWIEKARPLRGLKIVIFHRSWTYFTNRFGLSTTGEIEPKPGIPPGPGHLKDLIQKMKSENARIILMETFYDRKSSDFVANQTGASVAICALSVGGKAEVNDYISLIDHLINHLLKLGGK